MKTSASGGGDDDSGTDYEEDEDSGIVGEAGCSDFGEAAGGHDPDDLKKLLTPEEKSSGGTTSLKFLPPSSTLNVRPKCVMNDYDMPPTLDTHKLTGVPLTGALVPDKKNKTTHGLVTSQSPVESLQGSDIEENYYDEIHPHDNPEEGYDVPPNRNIYKNCSNEHDEIYYNEDGQEENMYESMENIRKELAQEKRQAAQDEAIEDVASNPYVPMSSGFGSK